MTKISVSKLMNLITPLDYKSKLELISQLSESLRSEFSTENISREKILEELNDSLHELEDNFSKRMLESRTFSKRDVSLD